MKNSNGGGIMNKSESKYFNTAILFDEALIHLLQDKDIEYITIKELCKKAGVNRSTFYLHYENINDLVEETTNYINNKFLNYFNEGTIGIIDKIKTAPLEELLLIEKKYLTPYLTFVKENKKIFKAAFNNPNGMKISSRYNHLKKYIIIPILERFNVSKKEQDYLITFYINGTMSIIKEWLKNECKDDITDIENIIIKCIGYQNEK